MPLPSDPPNDLPNAPPNDLPNGPPSDPLPEPPLASLVKPRWPVSRVVLLALLAVVIGLFVTDRLRGRMPRDRAYDLLIEQMPADEEALPKGSVTPPKHSIGRPFVFWTADKVHDLLKRSPDATEEKPNANHIDSVLTETYRYPGAFKTYLLIVEYDKRAHVAHGAPATTLTRVRRSG